MIQANLHQAPSLLFHQDPVPPQLLPQALQLISVAEVKSMLQVTQLLPQSVTKYTEAEPWLRQLLSRHTWISPPSHLQVIVIR